ncbi:MULTISPECIES: sulfotransferase [Methylobacter]
MKAFIIGTGRCGTSMLAQMLNSHSMICVPFELQILFECSNNGERFYEIFKEEKNEHFRSGDFINLIEAITPHKFHEYFDYRHFFEKQQYPIRSLKKLANDLFSEIAESKHKKIFIEQTPWYGQGIDVLNELFPDAKYIHMIRDGRDVAISFARTPWWHDDIGQNLERWHAEIRQIIDLSNRILKPNQILQVRYEDFVAQPESELRRICSFLSIDFEDAMLDPTTYIDYGLYELGAKNISSSALNKWSKNKCMPTFQGSRYAWKNYPNFDFSTIPEHVTQSLKNLGYDTQMPRLYSLRVTFLTLKKHSKKVIKLTIDKMYPCGLKRLFRISTDARLLSTLFKKIFVEKSRDQSTFCPVCGNVGVEFLPLPEFYRDNARLHGFRYIEKCEMLSLDAYTCIQCGASDRERIYALWIDQQIETKLFSKDTNLIHFAPEVALSKKLKGLVFDYKTADLLMDDVNYKVDMMDMPFDDESFDFFICSHVLEHVDSDDQVIKELYRITKLGGCGILVAPIIVGLEKTIEDPSVKDESGRWRLYGQDDHVRLYAHDDYVNKIRNHGFRVEELGESCFGKEVFRSLGLTRTSILYVVSK